MAVIEADVVFYGSATMPLDDAGTNIGGAIDLTKRVVFTDMSATGNVQVVSSAAGDTTQTVTVYGRDAAGSLISETKTLTGTTVVPMTTNTSWERLLRAVKSATTTGDVAAEAVTAIASGTAQGGAATTITLAAGDAGATDAYNDMVIRLTGGTGAGQIRRGVRHNSTTKVTTVDRAWATNPDATTTYKISRGFYFEKAPNEVLDVRRPFYNAFANATGGATRNYYEKIFARNNNATSTLSTATVIEQADPSANITFGLPATLGDTGTNGTGNNRLVAPTGITFDSATKNVANSGNLTAAGAQGVWLNLTLAAGAAAANTSFTLRVSGQTV